MVEEEEEKDGGGGDELSRELLLLDMMIYMMCAPLFSFSLARACRLPACQIMMIYWIRRPGVFSGNLQIIILVAELHCNYRGG